MRAPRLSLRTRIAATVAVAVLASTVGVTYAAYELERSGTETRFLAAARTGAVADLHQAAAAAERQPQLSPVKAIAAFVEQRGGILWVVFSLDDPQGSIGSGDIAAVPSAIFGGRTGGLDHGWTTLGGSRMLAVGGRVGGTDAALVEFYDFGPVERQLARLRSDLIRLDAIAIVAAVILGALVATGISRPVRLTAAAARRLGRGALDTRVPVRSNSELGDLAAAFNDMAQRLSAAMQALQDAQAQQRRFVSDVSHELRTPLAAMIAAAEGLDSADPALRRRSTQLVGEQTRRMHALVEDLLEISRFDAGQAVLDDEEIDLDALARDVVRTVAPDADVQVMTLGDAAVHADGRRLHTVLRNLVANAVQHGAPPVQILVDGRGDPVSVQVLDAGPGIDPAVAASLFDRFVRADSSRSSSSGSSTGLGLAIARENAQLHGATLHVQSGPPTAFVLTLPRRTGMQFGPAPRERDRADG